MLCFLYGLLVVELCRARTLEDEHLPHVQTCPRCFVPAAERLCSRVEATARRLLADESAIDFHAVAGLAVGGVLLCRLRGVESLFTGSTGVNAVFMWLTLTSLLSKLAGGPTHGLRLMARRLGVDAEQRALFDLRSRLSDLHSENAILYAASEAVQELLPGATASAVATFCPEDGDGAGELRKSYTSGGRLAAMEAIAVSQTERAALEAALRTGNSRDTSVAFALRHAATRGCHIAWSRDFPQGLDAFSDWRAARRAGLSGHAVTTPLVAGRVCVGFVTAHFSAAADTPSCMTSSDRSSRLQALCEIVGASVHCRRALDALEASQRVVADVFPPLVAKALEARAREESSPGAPPPIDDHVDDGGPVAVAANAQAMPPLTPLQRACSSPTRAWRPEHINGDAERTGSTRASTCSTRASTCSVGSAEAAAQLEDSEKLFRRSWSVDRRASITGRPSLESAGVAPRRASSAGLSAESFASVTIIFAGASACAKRARRAFLTGLRARYRRLHRSGQGARARDRDGNARRSVQSLRRAVQPSVRRTQSSAAVAPLPR